MFAQALGGIGLFLVGMILVTDGLRAAAGDALRTTLLRFTGGPGQALLTGAAVTAIVQSSSATTVATIGFVGAGLLTFHQALGLIFGANIGTTATGWIVAFLGLKFSVGALALPLVGVGALLRLFSRGRWAASGLAMAGFGVLFVGLDVLQQGMTGVAQYVQPQQLPQDTLVGRFLLLGIGVLLTTIMQSSSAAVAITLTALHAGTLSIHQAAAMVIGVNIGTTVTAGLAAIGGSTAAKRTAFAHLLFNALTGAVAFLVLPGFVWAISLMGQKLAAGDATILIAAFHTAFNILGVLLILPFSERFANMVTRVIRHKGPELTRLLDTKVARQGSLAIEAVRQTTIEIAGATFAALQDIISKRQLSAATRETLRTTLGALEETEQYLTTLHFGVPLSEEGHERHVATIHALDHLSRLLELSKETSPLRIEHSEFVQLLSRYEQTLASLAQWTSDPNAAAPSTQVEHRRSETRELRQRLRQELLESTATGKVLPSVASERLENLRWLEEISHHLEHLVKRLEGERNLVTDPVHRSGEKVEIPSS